MVLDEFNRMISVDFFKNDEEHKDFFERNEKFALQMADVESDYLKMLVDNLNNIDCYSKEEKEIIKNFYKIRIEIRNYPSSILIGSIENGFKNQKSEEAIFKVAKRIFFTSRWEQGEPEPPKWKVTVGRAIIVVSCVAIFIGFIITGIKII